MSVSRFVRPPWAWIHLLPDGTVREGVWCIPLQRLACSRGAIESYVEEYGAEIGNHWVGRRTAWCVLTDGSRIDMRRLPAKWNPSARELVSSVAKADAPSAPIYKPLLLGDNAAPAAPPAAVSSLAVQGF